MPNPVDGRGIKAPYETTYIKVPIPIKAKVQALIDEFRDSQTGQSEKALTRLDEPDNEASKSSVFLDLQTIESETEMLRCHASEVQVLNGKIELQREEIEFQREVFQSQTQELVFYEKELQSQTQELVFYEKELQSMNLLTNLEKAKQYAKQILKSKGSSSQLVARLLTEIYQTEVTVEDLKE